jgi:hypothetical protein
MRLARTQAWILALLLLLGALGAPAPARAKKMTLRLAIPAGEILQYRMDLEQEVNIQGMVITVTEGGSVEIAALESPSDTLRFNVRFDDFEGSLKRGDDLTERTPELNGVSLRCDVLPHGEVVRVQPLKAVRPSVLQQLKQLVDNFFPYLAREPVEPGDTWTEVRREPNPEDPSGPPGIDGSSEHTLDEWTKKDGIEVAKILTRGKAKINLSTEAGPIAGESKGESEALVALEDGRIVRLEARGSFSGTLGVMEGSRGETFRLSLVR